MYYFWNSVLFQTKLDSQQYSSLDIYCHNIITVASLCTWCHLMMSPPPGHGIMVVTEHVTGVQSYPGCSLWPFPRKAPPLTAGPEPAGPARESLLATGHQLSSRGNIMSREETHSFRWLSPLGVVSSRLVIANDIVLLPEDRLSHYPGALTQC